MEEIVDLPSPMRAEVTTIDFGAWSTFTKRRLVRNWRSASRVEKSTSPLLRTARSGEARASFAGMRPSVGAPPAASSMSSCVRTRVS